MNTKEILNDLTECELVDKVNASILILCQQQEIEPFQLDGGGRLLLAACDRDPNARFRKEGRLAEPNVRWVMEAKPNLIYIWIGKQSAHIPRKPKEAPQRHELLVVDQVEGLTEDEEEIVSQELEEELEVSPIDELYKQAIAKLPSIMKTTLSQ